MTLYSLQRPVPRNLDDVGAGDLVVPRLALRILENPQRADAEHGQRENAGEPSDERVGKTERRPIHADHAQLADDAADGRPLPRPEADVIREQEKEDRAVAACQIEDL